MVPQEKEVFLQLTSLSIENRFKYLNLKRLNDTYDDEEVIKDVLRTILPEIDDEFAKLIHGHFNEDWDVFIEAAHNLLNKSPYIGDSNLLTKFRETEEFGHKKKNGIEILYALESIQTYWFEIRKELIPIYDSYKQRLIIASAASRKHVIEKLAIIPEEKRKAHIQALLEIDVSELIEWLSQKKDPEIYCKWFMGQINNLTIKDITDTQKDLRDRD